MFYSGKLSPMLLMFAVFLNLYSNIISRGFVEVNCHFIQVINVLTSQLSNDILSKNILSYDQI